MGSFFWTAVEDRVLEALKARLGDRVGTLKTYQGNWRDDLEREGWRLPAVLVTVEEGRAQQVGPASYELTLQVGILVIVRQLRGEASGRRGPGGAYEILADVREALWHRDLGLNLLPLALVEERPVFSSREQVGYMVRFRTGMVQEF